VLSGVLRPDPFAMKQFCGYNISDYFAHWFSMEARSANAANLPKMFHVNWFRKNADGQRGSRVPTLTRTAGKFMWPGFGDNARVLKWIVERATGDASAKAHKTPIGMLPTADALDLSGLSVSKETIVR
jgi:phosphoenolpyruvate carboxykinase (GTP)